MVTTRRRGEGVGFGVVLKSKAEVKICIEELLGEGRLSAKTVDRPALFGAVALADGKEDIEGADNVERKGTMVLFGKIDLCFQDLNLFIKRCAV